MYAIEIKYIIYFQLTNREGNNHCSEKTPLSTKGVKCLRHIMARFFTKALKVYLICKTIV